MNEPLSSLRLVYEKSAQGDIEPLAARISNRLTEIGLVDHILIHYYTQRNVPYPYGIYIAFRKYSPRELIEMLERQDALDEGETIEQYEASYPHMDELRRTLEENVVTLLTNEVDDDDTHLEDSTPEYFGQAASSREWIITKVQGLGTYADSSPNDATFLHDMSKDTEEDTDDE